MNRKQQRVCKILVAWLVIASLGVSGFPGPQAEARQRTAVSLSYPLLQATQAPPTGYPPPEVTTIPPTLPPPPLASPTPPPTPTPSEWVQIALNYVSERYSIPIENLLVVNEHTRRYPLSGRTFQAVTLLDTRNPDKFGYKFEYSLLIDLSTRSIEEDLAAIQAAEDAAYLAKYGKLQPALYERLQPVSDDTVLPVAIWIANQGQERTDAEIYAELAAQFPAAAEALARGTKPFDVADPDLSEQIQAAYRQLHAQDITVRNIPLLDWLEKQGMSVEQQVGMPALTARLPKRIIMSLQPGVRWG